MSDVDLLRVDLHAHWVADERGRLERARTPEHRPAPLLVVATASDGSGLVWAASTAVPEDAIAPIAAVLADEPTAPAGPGWAPVGAARLAALVEDAGPVEVSMAYALDRPTRLVPMSPGAVLRTSEDPDAATVNALVPAPDRNLTAPWVVALVDGEVAAVCETARSAPDAAAAGVWTYAPHRRRGLATAVVAAWVGRVEGRTRLYGHLADNVASQGVARRVGFRPVGHWWWLRPGDPG